MGVRSHEVWQKNVFYHICVFRYAYAHLTLDVDLVSEYRRAGFLSADAGKTIVLTNHLLQTVIKLTFVANFGSIH